MQNVETQDNLAKLNLVGNLSVIFYDLWDLIGNFLFIYLFFFFAQTFDFSFNSRKSA